jgi:hypothetical protein
MISAAARPIPPAPPVITTVLSWKSTVSSS